MGARSDVSARAAYAVGLSSAEVETMAEERKSVLHAAHAVQLEEGVSTLTPVVEAKRVSLAGKSAGGRLKKSASTGIGARPALFYVDIYIGTPAQHFRVDLDTGSSTLAVPSTACSNCNQHCNSPFDHSQSSSWESISCTSNSCCSSSWYSCDNSCAPQPYNGLCGFSTRYGDGSGIAGVWGRDQVKFAGQTVGLNFGVFTKLLNDKTFMPYAVDGILGIADAGLNYNSQGGTSDTVMDAMKNQLGVPHIFSMCFGPKGGIMTVGGVDTNHMTANPSYSDAVIDYGYWGVGLSGMSVGGADVQLTDEAAANTIVDSGTTLWLMDSNMYSSFTSALLSTCTDTCKVLQALLAGYCVSISSSLVEQLPEVSVTLSGGGVATLSGQQYLRQGLCVGYESMYILGVADGGNINILGITFMQPYTWVFDKEEGQIGFAGRKNCNVQSSGMATCGGGSGGWGFGSWGFPDASFSIASLWDRSPEEYAAGGAALAVGVGLLAVAMRRTRGLDACDTPHGPRTPRRKYLRSRFPASGNRTDGRLQGSQATYGSSQQDPVAAVAADKKSSRRSRSSSAGGYTPYATVEVERGSSSPAGRRGRGSPHLDGSARRGRGSPHPGPAAATAPAAQPPKASRKHHEGTTM